MSQSALSKTCPAPSASLPSGAPSRRGDLDIARAVAALAVILHHIGQYFWLGDFPHFNPAIGRVTVEAVSYIHIPVFMFVAGIVLSLRPPQVADLLEYRRFEFQKMCRLMLPFVAISILHALVKVASPGKAMALLPDQALHSLIAPRGGLAGHLWFLYCLMSIFLVWPLVSTLGRKHMILLVAVLLGLAVAAVPWPLDPMDHGHPLAGLADLAWYLPIYVIGFWYGRSGASAVPRSPAVILGAGAVLVAAFWVHVSVSFGETFGEQTISRAIRMCGFLAGGSFVVLLCGHVDRWDNAMIRAGRFLGERSYDIYLLHVALVGHPLVFLMAKLHPGEAMTYACFVIAPVVTLTAALLLGQAIRRVPWMAFVVLGLPMPRQGSPSSGRH